MEKNVYTVVTARIIESIEKTGILPWQRPWKTGIDGLQSPKNLSSGKSYQGINFLLLNLTAFESPYWLTFLQCKERGGRIRKGAKGTPVVFWKLLEKEEESKEASEEVKVPIIRYSTVFNVEQCEGIDAPKVNVTLRTPFERIAICEQIVNHYVDGPNIVQGAAEALKFPQFR